MEKRFGRSLVEEMSGPEVKSTGNEPSSPRNENAGVERSCTTEGERAGRKIKEASLAFLASLPGISQNDSTRLSALVTVLDVLFDGVAEAVVVCDPSGRIVKANRAAGDLCGTNPLKKQLRTAFPLRFTAAENNGRQWGLIAAVIRNGKKVRGITGNMVSPRGDARDISLSLSPLFDSHGVPYGSVVTLTDVSLPGEAGRKLEELKKSEEEFRLLVSSISDYILFLLDEKGIITNWHAGAERVTGYRAEDVIGKSFSILHTDADAKKRKAEQALKAAAEQGRCEYGGWCVRKNGGWYRADTIVIRLNDGGGKLRGFIVIQRDVTELRRSEELLRERGELYRTLIDTSPNAIIVTDLNANIIMINQQAIRLFGLRNVEEVFGEKILGYIAPRERQRFQHELGEMPQRKIRGKECVFLKKDGDAFLGEMSASVVTNKDGVSKYRIVVINDISERRAIEDKIRHAAEEWRTTFDSISDLIAIMDRDSRIVRVNAAYAGFFGMRPKDLIGKTCRELFHDVHHDDFFCSFRKVLRTRKSSTAEMFDVRSGRYLEESVSPIFDEKGDVAATVHIIQDITERKKVHEILQRDKDNFERLVDERTRELLTAQNELEKARRLSDIGTLAATVAHELRNPLGVMRTAAYNLRRKSDNPSFTGHLDNIEKKILESDKIINNLLFYSRIKMPQYESIDICSLLDDCVAAVREQYRKWDVAIETDYGALSHEFVDADPLQMSEVFSNILNNAFEAMPGKAGRVRIKGGCDAARFRISIRDSGEGIDTQDMERILQPFFTRKSRGTGLGLTVSQQIVGLHGGGIVIKSEKGKGTEVTITLPRRRESND